MLNKTIVWLSKMFMIVAIFIAPSWYLIREYSNSETKIVETTENSMPMLVLILVSIFAGVIVIWVMVQIKVLYWEIIKKKPFGFVSTLSFGVVTVAIAGIAMAWLYKLKDLINANTQVFLDNIDMYLHNLLIILLWIGAGFLVGIFGFIWEKSTT